MQRGFRLAVARDVDNTDAAAVVRAANIVHVAEHKVVAVNVHAVAGLHAHIALHAVVLAERNADHRHRDPEVAQHHTPVAAGKVAQAAPETVAMGSALMQLHQRQNNHPHRHDQPDHRHAGDAVLQQPRQQDRQHQRDRQCHAQTTPQLGRFIATPAYQRADAHQQRHRRHQPGEHGIEEGFADRNAAQAQLFVHQRQQRAQQHNQHGGNQQHVIAQQEGFAREGFMLHPAAYLPALDRVKQQRTADHDHQIGEDKHAARRVGSKRVHRNQHAGAYQEGAQQAQREGGNGQQHRPGLEGAAFFGHRQRVHQRRTGQPRHKGRVFHRIPEPPAAPTQFVIGPGGPQHDPQGEKHPGRRGPGPRPARPGGIQPAGHQ
ncbi:hypothetical protein D3C79_589470 [compost metagenome]